MGVLQFILLQIDHPIWYYNAFFYLFVALLIYTIISSLTFLKMMRKRVAEMKLMQQQHVAKIDNIRKEHSDVLEKLRVEMLKREEDRTRQWIESEKETLNVLSGVSMLLDLSEKIGRIESEKILSKLDEIENNRNLKIEKMEEVYKKLDEIRLKVEKITTEKE
jgi:hypothetical protein